MSTNAPKNSFLDEKEAEENEIRRKDPPGFVPWSNSNKLQATDRNATQGPGTSGSRRVVGVSSTRQPDTSPGAEALSGPGRYHPVCIEENRPGAVVVPGIDSDGLTVEEAYDEQATIASQDQSTVEIIARAVDTEEENRMRRELDHFHHILDNAPIVTPVVGPNRDVEKGDEKVHAKHDDSPRSDDPQCGPRGRRWLAISATLLIAVAVAVTLVVVLPSEPTPSDPTTTAPTAEPATAQKTLSELLSSTSSDEVRLDFSDSGLDGIIPTEIGEFTKLTYLDLGGNELTGSIPSVIGLLRNLSYLDLYNNTLTGSIPSAIGLLTKLTLLDLSRNALTGSIPSVIGLLTNLYYLDLYDNALTGSIPSAIGLLSKLTLLDLSCYALTGSIPSVIGLLKNLAFLDLRLNTLTGSLPSVIGLLTNLAYLDLWDNELTGTIPSELGLLTKLTFLDLSANRLTGTVPTSLASLTFLDDLYLYGNDLTGSLAAFCGINFEQFVANACGQDEIICTCCNYCWNPTLEDYDPI